MRVRELAISKQRGRAGEPLRYAGAEISVGDLPDHDDATTATDGAASVYLCYTGRTGIVHVTAYFADVSRRTGLELVVNLSQISAREDSKSHSDGTIE
jgi:NAD(P)H dehydrogenase (quinone)